MKFLIIIIFLFSTNGFCWTINNSARMGFSNSDITIKIGSDTCSNANLTPASLEAIVKEAIDDYWNKAPTSSLKLVTAGNSGISLSGNDLTAAAAKADANSILIGCNQNATLFSSNSILGVGGIGCNNGICRAAVLMNDITGTNLASADHATIVTALSHEIGHAIGLGHSSIQGSIMYYSLTAKSQKTLHQDDIDGITYLYPNSKKISGLAGACGTISTNSKNKKDFLTSLSLGMAMILFLRVLIFAYASKKKLFAEIV
jgi:hypothetical protein